MLRWIHADRLRPIERAACRFLQNYFLFFEASGCRHVTRRYADRGRHIIVASMVAQTVSSAKASAVQTVNVRPDLLTRPTTRITSPLAGARRLTLNSTLSTREPEGMSV